MQTILLIEDTKSTIDLINTTLTENGYAVSIALSGKQGLKIANKLRPDLILMDILMPEMDGYETCKLLKDNDATKDIPVIFISALNKTIDKVKAFELGAVDFISKPIEIEELHARINTHLTIKKLQRKLEILNEELEAKVIQRTLELENINHDLVDTVEELFNKSAALLRSEERYRYITESISDYIYKVHISNNKVVGTAHSPSCESVTGFSEEELGNNLYLWYDIIYPDDRQRFNEFIEAFMKQPENCDIEHRIITKDGQVKWVTNTILAFINDDGILYEYNGIIRDITDRKKLEQEILNSIIETEEKERVRFSQEIHDGIGPILSAAKMYVQWIAQTTDKDDIPALLIKTTNLIEDAYNTSREISQKLSPHVLQNFGLIAALKHFIESINEANKVSVNLSSNCTERFDLQKETIIYRVITESINNTMKHAQASVITITLTKENDKLQIMYQDDGKGFDAERIIHDKKGLGLFNMKNRIEAVNGSYLIESSPTSGTEIRIQIPI